MLLRAARSAVPVLEPHHVLEFGCRDGEPITRRTEGRSNGGSSSELGRNPTGSDRQSVVHGKSVDVTSCRPLCRTGSRAAPRPGVRVSGRRADHTENGGTEQRRFFFRTRKKPNRIRPAVRRPWKECRCYFVPPALPYRFSSRTTSWSSGVGTESRSHGERRDGATEVLLPNSEETQPD